MDVREKLVDIVCDATQINGCIHSCKHPPCAMVRGIVDALITHGVTVQEWISVEDRVPDACGFPCLLCGKNSFGQIRVFEGFTGYMERGKFEWHSNQKDIDIDVWTITHWMPLPQPPKGE